MTELSNSIITMIRGMAHLSKLRKKFFTHVLSLFLSISGRVNFLQLARYSDKYVESSFRLHFEAYFDFSRFNKELYLKNLI